MVKRASRLNSRELKIIKSYLIRKFGSICQIDKKEYPPSKLVVDHIDNNPLNNHESNLQLICQSCNIKKNPPYKKNKKDVDNFSLGGALSVNECEGDFLRSYPNIGVNSYPVWKNLKAEPLFLSWVEKEMTEKLILQVDQVINDGAYYSDCSTKTAMTYLNKLVYKLGPYYIHEDEKNGIRYLKWKPQYFPYKENAKKK